MIDSVLFCELDCGMWYLGKEKEEGEEMKKVINGSSKEERWGGWLGGERES